MYGLEVVGVPPDYPLYVESRLNKLLAIELKELARKYRFDDETLFNLAMLSRQA